MVGFIKAKRASGQSLAGSTGRSNSARVTANGMAGGLRRKRDRVHGSKGFQTPILRGGGVENITQVSADVTVLTNRPDDGTLFWILSLTGTTPSQAQIKAGLDGNGNAAQQDGSEPMTASVTVNIIGMDPGTLYRVFAFQEAAQADSNVGGTFFTTLAVSLTDVGSDTITDTTANLNVTSNAAGGTLYVVCDEDAAGTPTPIQIINGQNSLGEPATFAGNAASLLGPNVIGATGLTTLTTYVFHFVTQHPAVVSNVTSETFTTI